MTLGATFYFHDRTRIDIDKHPAVYPSTLIADEAMPVDFALLPLELFTMLDTGE